MNADELDYVLIEECPEVRKVEDAACDPVEFKADNGIDLSVSNIRSELLKLGTIPVLGTSPRFAVDPDELDLVTPEVKLQVAID